MADLHAKDADMLNPQRDSNEIKHRWWTAMFRDAQFWVPLAILFAGLIVLAVIQ